MKTGVRIGIIIGSVAALAGIVYYFVIRKKPDVQPLSGGGTGTGTGSGTTDPNTPDVQPEPILIGKFDWVGKGDFGDKKNYWANLHILDFGKPDLKLKGGDILKIKSTSPNWNGVEGAEVRIIKFNPDSGTMMINVAAPVDGNTLGYWEFVGEGLLATGKKTKIRKW